jgi:hypothetical protein
MIDILLITFLNFLFHLDNFQFLNLKVTIVPIKQVSTLKKNFFSSSVKIERNKLECLSLVKFQLSLIFLNRNRIYKLIKLCNPPF